MQIPVPWGGVEVRSRNNLQIAWSTESKRSIRQQAFEICRNCGEGFEFHHKWKNWMELRLGQTKSPRARDPDITPGLQF